MGLRNLLSNLATSGAAPKLDKDRLFERLHNLVGDDLSRTNDLIRKHLNSQVPLIPTLGSHLIESGGKRLRPILTLLTARMFGYRDGQDALLAAVVEFIHTATLLHDDVVDNSVVRRGKSTANTVWGEKAPILVGDFLFSRSFQMLVELGDLHVLKILSDTCAIISEGEVMQLISSKDLSTTEEIYLDVVTRKTAVLFSAAAQLGAVLAGRPKEEEQAMSDFGLLLGQAYQLMDDALDYAAEQKTLGKEIGDDFNEGKITLPILHAFHQGTEEEQAFWRAAIEKGDKGVGGLERAIELINQKGSLDYTLQKARDFIDQAKAKLAGLPATPEKDALVMIAEFSVDREF